MTPTLTLISVGIALMTIILSIFGASWLNQRALEKHTDLLREMFAAEFKAIDARFAAVEARLDRIERQLDAVFKPSLPK